MGAARSPADPRRTPGCHRHRDPALQCHPHPTPLTPCRAPAQAIAPWHGQTPPATRGLVALGTRPRWLGCISLRDVLQARGSHSPHGAIPRELRGCRQPEGPHLLLLGLRGRLCSERGEPETPLRRRAGPSCSQTCLLGRARSPPRYQAPPQNAAQGLLCPGRRKEPGVSACLERENVPGEARTAQP